MTKVKVIKGDKSQVFNNEFDDTPHPNAKHHSSIKFKPLHNFDRHLQ
jgi:hypothetical protein